MAKGKGKKFFNRIFGKREGGSPGGNTLRRIVNVGSGFLGGGDVFDMQNKWTGNRGIGGSIKGSPMQKAPAEKQMPPEMQDFLDGAAAFAGSNPVTSKSVNSMSLNYLISLAKQHMTKIIIGVVAIAGIVIWRKRSGKKKY